MRAPLSALLLVTLSTACDPPPRSLSDATSHDAGAASIGPNGGTVDRLHFAVFGDVRPPSADETAAYPTDVITQVMEGMASLDAEFAIGTGDYVYAYSASSIDAQLDLLLRAEDAFARPVFHALGNHDCDTATAGNCVDVTATANIRAFHARLAPAYATAYMDFTVQTSSGDAHFVLCAPNAWTDAQSDWLSTALAMPSRYTFVVAHESPYSTGGPGSAAIEAAIAARTEGVTLRLYGHTHAYRHPTRNVVISGNAGAPLDGTSGAYGFVIVDQTPEGAIAVTAYEIGTTPLVTDAFMVTAAGEML